MAEEKDTAMGAVIERLKASKAAHEEQQTERGHAAGRRWAKHTAKYEELTRLDKVDPEDEPINAIHKAVDPDAEQEWGEVLEALGASHADLEDDTFAQAFLNGAREVYDEVEDQLDE